MEEAARNEKSITRVEKDILGLTHEEIGIAIGKHWNFEKRYLYAVGRHHEPAPGGNASHYAMVVGTADYCVRQLNIGSAIEGRVASIPAGVWEALGLEEEGVMETLTFLEEEIQKARVFLE
jgi:HD-like signal output (HDOD) protein